MRTTRSLGFTVITAAISVALAILGMSFGAAATYAKGPNDPATECLIAVSAGGSFVDLQCKDGDACDADGQTGNGSCEIMVKACTDVVASGCAAKALKSATVHPKKLGITVTPSGATSVCGSGRIVLKLRGAKKDRPSKKLPIVATAKGTDKGAKDVDKLKVQCVPCGSTSCVPATTTSTIVASTSSTSTTAAGPSTSTSSTTTTVAPSTSTTTSTIGSTTSTSAPTTSSTSSTSATSTTVSTTTSTSALFDFLSTVGAGTCGNTYKDPAGTIPLKNLGCGSLSLGGGKSQVPDNATPSGATNRFTLSGCTGTTCNIGPTASGSTPAGVDCTDVGCRFGLPLPISNSGLSVCVTNTFSPEAPSGTLDTGTGAATWRFQLNSATVLTGNPTLPCPICAVSVGGAACAGTPGSPCTGVCDGSPNQGTACQSTNPNGLSSDCPPAGQKCYRGSNNGGTCSIGSDCPGGQCAQFIGNIAIDLNPLTTATSSLSNADGLFCPGQGPTQKGAFRTSICRNGANTGKPCAVAADCGAGGTECRTGGPLPNYCVGGANDGMGCGNAIDCPSPGTCVQAGTQVQLISETGTPAGALTPGVPSTIKLGSSFCVPLTTNGTVNGNANLPGPGATNIVGAVTLLP